MSAADADFWSCDRVVDYYAAHRGREEELYPSERRFLGDVFRSSRSLLDVGCAAGNLSAVAKAANPALRYAGVDVSAEMIDRARTLHPGDDFAVTDGRRIETPDASHDAVVCLGVLHMNLDWRELLAEAWRAAAKTFVFDLRLTDGPTVADRELAYQKLEFGGQWDGVSTAPYVIVNAHEAAAVLAGLSPAPFRLEAYGYLGRVSEMTVAPMAEVCMSVFKLSKAGSGEAPGVFWNLPIEARFASPGQAGRTIAPEAHP